MTEASRGDGRIRLTILGGFLGAGKSTWLRHQLHAGGFGKAHVLVNEAAETPVDHLLLARAHRLTLLSGGCACCEGRDELIAALHEICDAASRESGCRPERIVLETSGLADPGRIAEAIRADQVLVRHIVLEEVTVLADAMNAAHQLATEPLGRRQIETADSLIVSKADAVSAEVLARLVATLKAVNPSAVVTAAARGEAMALPVDTAAMPYPLPRLEGGGAPIRPTRLVIGKGDNWVALSAWLSAVLHARGDDVVRVKGVVRTPAGRLLLQSVRRTVQPPEILPEIGEDTDENAIVFIGRRFDAATLERSYRLFAG